MSDLGIAARDARDIYLGNLNTVEFDLELPQCGTRESTIEWQTNNSRFVSETGHVTQPKFGMGPRDVTLTAHVQGSDGSVEERSFVVHVIEAKNDIQIKSVRDAYVEGKTDELVRLPSVVIVTTEAGIEVAHAVEWSTSELIFNNAGEYTVTGVVLGTDYPACAKAVISDNYHINKIDVSQVAAAAEKGSVTLLPSEFAAQQDRTLQFLLQVNDDQMLYNFRSAAGLDTRGAPQMIGWDAPECLLKGHTTGHYLSALAAAFLATKNMRIAQKAHYMVSELQICQTALEDNKGCHKGFLSAYGEEQFDLLENYTPYPTIWAPYYTLHKILAGLVDCYKAFSNPNALALAQGIGEWVFDRLHKLSADQRAKMWSIYIAGEFGGMNDALCELYRCTQDEKYIRAAQFFDNDKLFVPMELGIDTLTNIHANQHIPQVIGALNMYKATGIKRYLDIAENFWDVVVGNHSYVIGGTGESEMWHEPNEIATRLTEHTAESCCSYNMLKLSSQLYQIDGQTRRLEYIERVLFNHILASGDKHGHGASTYFMPLAPGFQKEFDDENSCCHGTGLENHFKYNEYIYYSTEDSIQITQLIPSKLMLADAEILELLVSNSSDSLHIKVHIKHDVKKDIKIRVPSWAKPQDLAFEGQGNVSFTADGEWIVLAGVACGSKLSVNLTCNLRFESAPDDEHMGSVLWGPYVLAFLSDKKDYLVLSAEPLEERFTHIASGPYFELQTEAVQLKPLAFVDDERHQIYVRR